MPNASVVSQNTGTNDNAENVPSIPFTRAARELTERGFDETKTVGASSVSLSEIDVPSIGWLRTQLIDVLQSGGAAGLNNAVAEADGPWAVLSEIAFIDVNGQPFLGPMTGYDFYLLNKYGGFTWDSDPANLPGYAAIDNDGDFRFQLRLPSEIIGRNALGSLPNQNSAAAYKIRITVGDETKVYSTSPDTIGSLRLRSYVEAWSQPNPQAPNGAPQRTQPPFVGTVQYATKQVYNVASGDQTVRLTRVGNLIRNLILVFRDSSNDRDDTIAPDPISLYLDGQPIMNHAQVLHDAHVRERYGFAPDSGVIVFPFTHDFDGHPGAETKDLWLPTTQSSRLEVRGSFGANATTMDVITNDVRPNTGGVIA